MAPSEIAGFPPTSIREIANEVSALLKEQGATVSVAETAAGGLISSTLLATPGASGFYRGGVTVYTLESRIAFAGWTEEHLKDYKGPTPEIVAGLAESVRTKLGSTFAISESGTAGPTGGATKNRTPGYVALAVSSKAGTVTREVETGKGTDREANMVAFASEALKLLRDCLIGRVQAEL
ncbi:hypothetical protein PENANT_c026G01643 [Penicillium antarcticum]|uniref:CinA C-terminal domain-containing protein n=1 Tax=Penicillium antarcticum TaxID=416450 RepID=A0A1V6PX74_9EURO|nr:uncharacterized protein N7508_000095 [Penicillium antarcticum]KAJ5319812.1 hypothetical protein N7508_000095 [Penicillium antarcticum]OQD81624.1 hypothetical protein PENANT_c026G01643 [Penicillium antarcticum]